jgi:hypothetical protein
MMLLCQHGHGKSNKIDQGIKSGDIAGAILGPCNESPDGLISYSQKLRKAGATSLIDPQLHACQVKPPKHGKLPEYDYYQSPFGRMKASRSSIISSVVSDALSLQQDADVTSYISPTVHFTDFNDAWSQASFAFADESISWAEENDDKEIYISLVMSEACLKDHNGLSKFLDDITELDVHGFYIVIDREYTTYTTDFDPRSLSGLMQLAYILGDLNEYSLIFGYTDLVGVVLSSFSNISTACGWYNSLRQFSMNRFQYRSGGRPPKPRYTSCNLLDVPPLNPDVANAEAVGALSSIQHGSTQDASLAANFHAATWSQPEAIWHHWNAVNHLCSGVRNIQKTANRLDHVESLIQNASALRVMLENQGVAFTPPAPAQYDNWQQGISDFRSDMGI